MLFWSVYTLLSALWHHMMDDLERLRPGALLHDSLNQQYSAYKEGSRMMTSQWYASALMKIMSAMKRAKVEE